MQKILILSALPIEYSSSSIICLRSIIDGLAKDNYVDIISPYEDPMSRYYDKDFKWKIYNMRIFHVGRPKSAQNEGCTSEKKNKQSFMARIKNVVYKIYKRYDIFGKAILNVRYISAIKEIACGEKYDYIISASDPKASHVLANRIVSNLQGAYYIQYWGDPLAYDISSTSKLPVKIKLALEKSILKKADKIVYVSPLTAVDQRKLFQKYERKICFLPTPTVEDTISSNRTLDYKCVLGYFGSYNSIVRNIKPLYEAVKKCPECFLYIIGDSDVALEPTSNICIIERVAVDELKKYMCECDVLVDLMNFQGAQIPAKIYRDAGTNKEVLLLTDGERGDELKEYFEKYNRYTFCPNEQQHIIAKIEAYINEGIPERKAIMDFLPATVANKLLEKV